jgi:four helix bundle protein
VIDFKTLKVWSKSHEITLAIYQVTQHFPSDEWYGLTSQMRRACASIPTNIAEGCGRDSDAELARFCQIALGSAYEVDYQLLLARDLDYLDDLTYTRLNNAILEIEKMLYSFSENLVERFVLVCK